MSIEFPHVDGVAHRFVEVGGVRFHVAEAGEGDPLVLLHGWPQHWYMWRKVIPRLASRYRVICPDLRGLGWSDAPEHGYEKETMAADVFAVLDELGIERFKLAGHDWGGYIGFLMSLFQPERVERFLALCVVHPWPKPSLPRIDLVWRTSYQWVLASPAGPWLLRTQPAIVERGLRSATRDKNAWSDEELRAFSTVLQDPQRARASSQIYRTFVTRELLPLAAGRYSAYRLEVPTRLLVARHDPAIAPELIEGYEEHADDMDARVIEDVSHFIVDEAPDLVATEIETFFG